MTDAEQTTLVLGGTGRTGSLVAQKLIERGLNGRTASRHDADVLFDWDDPTTHARALEGVDRVYLVTPVMRVKYAGLVSDFLDLAAGAGVRHVTYLSTYGSDRAPPEVDIRAVELDLACRGAFTHLILRPAWVMQNFSDEHLPVIGEVADIIADVIGGPVTHNDIDADAWIGGAIAAGFVPADYAVMLRWLTGTIISGNGSRPNDDVEKVTGRRPITFQDFARRNAHAWTLQAAK